MKLPRILLAAGLAALALPAVASADSIVYIDQGNVWSAEPDGCPQGPADHRRQLALADAGRRRHDRRRPGHRPDPGHGPRRAPLRTITTPPAKSGDGGTFAPRPVQLSFSPDGTKIAYAYVGVLLPGGLDLRLDPALDVLHDRRHRRRRRSASTATSSASSNPEWVTNSRTLVFGGYGRQVAIDDLDAGDYNAKPWMVPNGDMGDGEVSRDGKRLAVTSDYGANKKLTFFAVSGNVATEFPPAYPELSCETTQRRREVRRPVVVARRLRASPTRAAGGITISRFTQFGPALRRAERLHPERDRLRARLGPGRRRPPRPTAAGDHAARRRTRARSRRRRSPSRARSSRSPRRPPRRCARAWP